VDSRENGVQLISLILKQEHFISEIMLEGFGIGIVISGSNLHAVPPHKFNAYWIEHVVMATSEDQQLQDSYNAPKDIKPSSNLEYLH
jgi:hypothetical protein